MSQRRMPAEIYWRRRMLALAGLILLIWVAFQVFDGGNEPEATPAAPVTSATPSASPSPTPDPIITEGAVDVSLTADARGCDPESVRVTPAVPTGQFTQAPVAINLLLSSTDEQACTLTAKDAELLVVISANGTPVYDSTVCRESLLKDPVVLSPGWASQVSVEWSGRGSGSACTGKEGFATQGKYLLQVGTLGGEPGKATFTIDDKPKPKETTKPAAKDTTKPADE